MFSKEEALSVVRNMQAYNKRDTGWKVNAANFVEFVYENMRIPRSKGPDNERSLNTWFRHELIIGRDANSKINRDRVVVINTIFPGIYDTNSPAGYFDNMFSETKRNTVAVAMGLPKEHRFVSKAQQLGCTSMPQLVNYLRSVIKLYNAGNKKDAQDKIGWLLYDGYGLRQGTIIERKVLCHLFPDIDAGYIELMRYLSCGSIFETYNLLSCCTNVSRNCEYALHKFLDDKREAVVRALCGIGCNRMNFSDMPKHGVVTVSGSRAHQLFVDSMRKLRYPPTLRCIIGVTKKYVTARKTVYITKKEYETVTLGRFPNFSRISPLVDLRIRAHLSPDMTLDKFIKVLDRLPKKLLDGEQNKEVADFYNKIKWRPTSFVVERVEAVDIAIPDDVYSGKISYEEFKDKECRIST